MFIRITDVKIKIILEKQKSPHVFMEGFKIDQVKDESPQILCGRYSSLFLSLRNKFHWQVIRY